MRRNETDPMSFLGHRTSTLEEIAAVAPAAFSTGATPKASDRYSFVSTVDLLNAFEKLGWMPHSTKQLGKGNDLYSRHLIRLNNDELGFLPLKSDKVKPQIIIDNSHDRTSNVMAHMGLFRLVCTNGLVVAMPGMYSSIKLRHIGIDFNELKKLSEVIAVQYNTVGKHISEMQEIILDADQQEEFVMKAVAYRDPKTYIKEDGTIDFASVTARVNPVQILEPLRGEDKKDDLWTIFNIAQEKMVKGLFEKQNASGRKSSPRGITNVGRSLEFNKVLWSIAEEFLGGPEDLTGKMVYTSAKGNKMDVEIVQKLDGNKYQVKSSNNLIFAVDAEQLS